MQILKFITLLSLIILCSCGKDSSSHAIEEQWDVLNISGGIAGFNCDFPAGDYLWTFSEDQLIRHLITPSNCITLTEKDTFDYSILEDTGREFLELNEQVYGELVFSSDSLFIDTNSRPNGSAADGFAYVLIK